MIFGDETARCWKQIIHFNADVDNDTPTSELTGASAAASQPDFEDVYQGDQTLIRDDRGVRLAREVSENAD